MKILQVTPSFFPQRGGVEMHVAEVSALLEKDGHQVSIVTVAAAEMLSAKGESLNAIRMPHTFKHSKLNVWGWIWQHRKLFFSADIVQIHDVAWWVLPLLPFIYKKLSITFHGWEETYPIPWQHKLQRLLFAKTAHGTMHVGSWISEFYWDTPTLVTYGGVNLPESKKTADKPLYDLAFVGRLEAANDIEKYLELVKLLSAKRENLKCIWIGDGTFRSECEKLGMVTGMIESPEKYLLQAKLVMASSYLSIMSAQAHQKVVIALYSHTLKKRYLETYPGAAEMLVGSSVPEMVEKIMALLDDREVREKRGLSARKLVSDLSWPNVVKQYYQLWGGL